MDIKSVKLQYEKNLLSILGVTGVGIDRPNQKIIVYIEDPKVFNFELVPLALGEFEIEFRVAPQPHYLQSSCTNRDRPLIGGVCFGVEWYEYPDTYVACGTLGAIVRNIDTNEESLLTNRHVIEDNYGNVIFNIINPCGLGGDIIGQVHTTSMYDDDWFDVALIAPFVDTQRTIKSIGEVQGAVYPKVGISVKKYGMKTGLTSGTITDIDYSSNINGIYYTDQILTNIRSDSGDSGSIMLDNQNKAVGLLMAGGEGITVANKMSNIIKVFKIYFNNPNELEQEPPVEPPIEPPEEKKFPIWALGLLALPLLIPLVREEK